MGKGTTGTKGSTCSAELWGQTVEHGGGEQRQQCKAQRLKAAKTWRRVVKFRVCCWCLAAAAATHHSINGAVGERTTSTKGSTCRGGVGTSCRNTMVGTGYKGKGVGFRGGCCAYIMGVRFMQGSSCEDHAADTKSKGGN